MSSGIQHTFDTIVFSECLSVYLNWDNRPRYWEKS